MKFTSVASVFLALLWVPTVGLRAQTPEPTQRPLTKVQVYDLIAGGVDPERIAEAVQKRGINFEPTDEYLESVRSKGATQVLLDALRTANTALSKSELLAPLRSLGTTSSRGATTEMT